MCASALYVAKEKKIQYVKNDTVTHAVPFARLPRKTRVRCGTFFVLVTSLGKWGITDLLKKGTAP